MTERLSRPRVVSVSIVTAARRAVSQDADDVASRAWFWKATMTLFPLAIGPGVAAIDVSRRISASLLICCTAPMIFSLESSGRMVAF